MGGNLNLKLKINLENAEIKKIEYLGGEGDCLTELSEEEIIASCKRGTELELITAEIYNLIRKLTLSLGETAIIIRGLQDTQFLNLNERYNFHKEAKK